MTRRDRESRRRWRWLIVAAVVVGATALTIDDWSRDLIGSHAEISETAPQEDLRPYVSPRSTAELAVAVQWAAKRLCDWEFIGEARVDPTTTLVFERKGRILRLVDDIVVRIEDRGSERVITAESQSRVHLGDLGRNPRNLRNLLTQLRDVLDGASKDPAAMPAESS